MSGRNRHNRDVMGVGLAALQRLARSETLDRMAARPLTERALYRASRAGFRAATAAGAANRVFAARRSTAAAHRAEPAERRDGFDLTPTDEQRMIVDATQEFAADLLRPCAAEADATCAPPDTVLKRSVAELGINQLGIPEALGGMSSQRSVTTGALVAEALAYGDLGLAVACLAPSAVSTALVLWGNASQQATYLPSFVGDDVPAAALTIVEPHALFDPFALRTTARRESHGFVLNGVKSMVPRAGVAELFVVAAMLDGAPALFLVESSTSGVGIEAEPAMGLRAASTGRLLLDDVHVPAAALLGAPDDYADCVRLSRLAWAALACGTGKAVLDYVVPYVNERTAFGEPISHRQAVAFMVANIAIELEGARLVTLRAAARAEQGRSFARETALARRLTSEYGMQIGNNGVQLLGGHGYVTEHPVERWYRDLRAVGIMEGTVLL